MNVSSLQYFSVLSAGWLRSFLFIVGVLFCSPGFSQSYTISGYVTDETDGEALIGVNVFDKTTLKGAVTNFYGFYSLTLPTDTVQIVISYIGYNAISEKIILNKDTDYSAKLSSKSTQLDEVEIVASSSEVEDVHSTRMSAFRIKPADISSIPTIGGEVDLIKVIQLMPGVSRGSEGGTGMHVRGVGQAAGDR